MEATFRRYFSGHPFRQRNDTMKVCARVLPLLSCATLCSPTDCGPPGSSVHGISQAEYWRGWLFPPPGDRPNPGIETASLASPALAGGFLTTVPPGKP